MTILSGTEEDVDKYHPEEIVKSLLEQVSNRTGFFAQRVKANGLPDSPGGGGILGWGAGVSGGFEHYDETETLTVEVDAAFTREQELAFGFNFPNGGAEMASYTKNVTDTSKPFPTDADFKAQKAQIAVCRNDNLKALKALLDQGLINQTQHDAYVDNAIKQGCHVDYTISANDAIASKTDAAKKTNLKIVDQLDFATFKRTTKATKQEAPK